MCVGRSNYKTNFWLQFNDPQLERDMDEYLLSFNQYSLRTLTCLIFVIALYYEHRLSAFACFITAIFALYANNLPILIR